MAKSYLLGVLLGPLLAAIVCAYLMLYNYSLAFLLFVILILLIFFWGKKSSKAFPMGMTAMSTIASIAFALFALNLKLFEGGFNDGPFPTYPTRPIASDSVCSISLVESNRTFCIQNYPDGNFQEHSGNPRLSLIGTGGETLWTVRFDTEPTKPGTWITDLREPRYFSGAFRNRIEFLGCWSYGCEAGILFLTKWDYPIRYYLSW